jgi:hypothetical protein
MKRLSPLALVLAVSACFVSLALAGGGGKSAKSAGSSDCCGAKSTATAATAAAACPASMSCPAGSAQCTAAQHEKCAKAAKTTSAANMGSCTMHGATATTAAASGSCASHGTSAAASSGCPMTGKSAMAAGGCTMHGTAAAGGKCDMGAAAHGSCAVCTDETACDQELHGLNSRAQVVELRNGSMIVYTADTPETVRALQVSLARHNEQVLAALATNSDANLCTGCKTFRGAMASGKFSRELVNVKTGVQVLLTSNDRTIVQRIHELTGAQTPPAARTKS